MFKIKKKSFKNYLSNDSMQVNSNSAYLMEK